MPGNEMIDPIRLDRVPVAPGPALPGRGRAAALTTAFGVSGAPRGHGTATITAEADPVKGVGPRTVRPAVAIRPRVFRSL